MSLVPVRTLATAPERDADPPRTAAKGADDPALARACVEFEGVLVRQLLSTMKPGSDGSGYGSMITDAMAGAVADGGGLGMAESIRRALGDRG